MKVKRFSDFFGSINFSCRNETGDNIADGLNEEAASIEQLRDRASVTRFGINAAANHLNINGKVKAIATHNANAEKFAAELAKDWGMFRCKKCGRYGFEDACEHEGCAK